MKKNKLLVPILAVAGLGATIAPLVVMTSCSCNPKSDGKEIDEAAFRALVQTVEENFEKNHNTYSTSGVQMKIIEPGNERIINPEFISEEVKNDHRKVSAIYDEFNKEEISCYDAFNTIFEFLDAGETVKFIEYTDYVHAEYIYIEEDEGIVIKLTLFWDINKNGFLKAKGETTTVGEETTTNAFYFTYAGIPRAVTEFSFTSMDNDPSIWLDPNTTYTVRYNELTSTNKYTKFWIGGDTGLDLDIVSSKINDQDISLNKDSSNKYSFNELKENDSFEIKFKTKESEGVCKQIWFRK